MDYHRVPRRIWDRLDPTASGCLLWPGATGGGKTHRYGIAHFEKGGKLLLVHREIFSRVVRPALPSEHVHHVCGTPLCANPLHLQAIPIAEHIGQWHRDKTHCPHGHPYDVANTYVRRADNGRQCRTCSRERARRRRAEAVEPI